MAKKKRRDDKRDPSTTKRILKAGRAALAVGAGVALLASNDKTFNVAKKAMTELLPTAKQTKKAFQKELFGKKKTAMNLYNAYNKAVGKNGEVVKDALLKNREKAAKNLKIKTSRTTTLHGKYKNIRQMMNNDIADDAKKHYEDEVLKGTVKAVKEHFKDKYDDKALADITKSAFAKIDKASYENEIGKDFLKKTLAKYQIDEKDADDIMRMVADQKEKYITQNAIKNEQDKWSDLGKEIQEKLIEGLKKDTRSNLRMNKIGKIFGIDNLEEVMLGSRAMTYKEFRELVEKKPELFDASQIENYTERIANQMFKEDDPIRKRAGRLNVLTELDDLNKQMKGAFDDVIVDRNLRVRGTGDDIDVFDISQFNNMLDEASRWFSGTLPGKVLTKGIDRQELREAPMYAYLRAGKKATISWLDEAEDQILKEGKLFIDGKVYGIDTTGDKYKLTEVLADDVYLSSNKHGSYAGVMKRMLGSDKRQPLAYDNKLARMLDINQDGESNVFAKIEKFFTKYQDEDWGRNVINRVQWGINSGLSVDEQVAKLSEEMGISKVEAMTRMYEDRQVISHLFKERSSRLVVSDDAIAKMLSHLDEMDDFDQDSVEHVRKMLNIALSKGSPEEMIEAIQEENLSSGALAGIINSYNKNANETLRRLSIESKAPKKIPILDIELSETNVEYIEGILRKESLKEATYDIDILNELILNSGLTDQEQEAVALLGQWTHFDESISHGEFSASLTSLFSPGGSMEQYQDLLDSRTGSQNVLNRFLDDFKSDFGITHSGWIENQNENFYSEFNEYEVIKKSKWSPNELLKDINDASKWQSRLAELNGGRDHLENVSTATVALQYMINRLSYGVEEAGLGLSSQSMKSPLHTVMNMMTKRVLPAMLAYTAFDYLNDLSEDTTGVSILGAGANSLRNIDVAGRRFAYSVGLGQAVNWWEQTSVIAEYWTGDNHYQNAEERAEWYQDGYSPVRKSRFWGFGSTSEFRGGDISFFQPNFYRRIHSDYKDKVLYGSNDEKWAHSIIPTPTHPFSTLRYLWNPYWLEEKHIDDAPTPLTGKMFAEGTVWGDILNPTIGQAIKPQIMLPEIRKRMTGKGHDVQGMLRKINQATKRKASENDDLLVVNGTDIRNATYVPYGNATPDVLTLNQYGYARGINYMEGVANISDYRTPDGSTYVDTGASGYGRTVRRTVDDSIVSSGIVQELGRESDGMALNMISGLNEAIKDRVFGKTRRGGLNGASPIPDSKSEGTYYYNNMVNEYNKYVDQYYSDRMDPAMINKNPYSDMIADTKHSLKNLSGIYGFLGEQAFGETSYTFRYENAGAYSSFSRGFWDANVGGLGGGVMEIARRFFPSQDRSRIDYNPLVNNMPEWLPDNFHYGVPWTKVTKGEMRLPGKGYEALNELHPDEYGEYGAFDRYKILADVAPNSEEYKTWRNIAKHTVTDPELQAEMKEIEARKKRMSGSHEFYEYQYLHTNTKYESDVIKEIRQDGTVQLASNKVLKLAGIEFNENYAGELNQILKPGQKIRYRTTDDAINDLEEGVIRNAAIFSGVENVNKRLIEMGVAERDVTDTSAIGQLATVSSTQEILGAMQELVAHARIPIFHNKLLHVETALESFVSEQVNGANFQTWDNPIQGIVTPMVNEVKGQSVLRRALAIGYSRFHFDKVMTMSTTKPFNKAKKFGSGVVLATLDPGAMLGGTLYWLKNLGNGRTGDGSQVLGAWNKGAKVGSTVSTAVWAYANADNPFEAALSFGAIGIDLYNKFEVGEFAEEVLQKSSNKILRQLGTNMNWKKAGTIGVAVGLGLSALKNPDFNFDRMFGKHMPKKYQKVNELNEYFDRLEYIKYKGLYEDAARKAALFEKSTIKDTFKRIDKNKKKIAKLENEKRELLDKYDELDPQYLARVADIDKKISGLKETGNNMFKGGKYTKSAVAYKKAMESTIYGLSEGATKDEILAAVPDQYKDYFQSFMNVTDKSEQKKILSYLPDYMKRPLQLAWGMKLDDVQSNREYFRNHKLPSFNWRGWKPNINLKHVQMKTIENEGMLLADFGFYESEKAKASYTMAPDIDNYDQRNKMGGITTFLNLGAELRGLGVTTSNVSLERTNTPGFWISSDIKQSIEDRYEMGSHSMTQTIQGLVSNFI